MTSNNNKSVASSLGLYKSLALLAILYIFTSKDGVTAMNIAGTLAWTALFLPSALARKGKLMTFVRIAIPVLFGIWLVVWRLGYLDAILQKGAPWELAAVIFFAIATLFFCIRPLTKEDVSRVYEHKEIE